jgi:hypothetical protein
MNKMRDEIAFVVMLEIPANAQKSEPLANIALRNSRPAGYRDDPSALIEARPH